MSMPFWINWARRGCLPGSETWKARLRTGKAMVLLSLARLLIIWVPFRLWSSHLGSAKGARASPDPATVRHLSAHIERATWRLPFAVKCLPQAAVLSWQLRRRGIAHRVVIAVRPPSARGGADDLHAWVECGAAIVLGERPGPWVELHSLGEV